MEVVSHGVVDEVSCQHTVLTLVGVFHLVTDRICFGINSNSRNNTNSLPKRLFKPINRRIINFKKSYLIRVNNLTPLFETSKL